MACRSEIAPAFRIYCRPLDLSTANQIVVCAGIVLDPLQTLEPAC
jgi:hypothetical protein